MTISPESYFARSSFAAPDSIVVATDLTDIDYLVPHAIAQAKASHAALTFIHALELSESFPSGEGVFAYKDPLKASRDARLAMEGVARQVRAQGVECATAVRHGPAIEVIREIVHQTGAGRLIAGTHSRRGMKKAALSSVTIQLLKLLNIPVCVIGPQARPSPPQVTPRTILHPVSLSGDYEQTARLALNLSQHIRAQLILLHVFDPTQEFQIAPGRTVTFAYSSLDRLVPNDDLYPSVLTKETVGPIVPEILRVANEVRTDMIVLGVHADSFFWTPQGGRKAYQIIASASCPVLTLKTASTELYNSSTASARALSSILR